MSHVALALREKLWTQGVSRGGRGSVGGWVEHIAGHCQSGPSPEAEVGSWLNGSPRPALPLGPCPEGPAGL